MLINKRNAIDLKAVKAANDAQNAIDKTKKSNRNLEAQEHATICEESEFKSKKPN